MDEAKCSCRWCGIPGLGLIALFGEFHLSTGLHFLTCVYQFLASMRQLPIDLVATSTVVPLHRSDSYQ